MEGKLSRNPVVDFTPMKNESVLFQPRTNQFCLLNATATFIWSEIEQPRTVSELANTLCNHFHGVSFAEAVRDVEQMVDQLSSLGCLAPS
jgi:coenzyme PQQ synthesis protein D (PqqD)